MPVASEPTPPRGRFGDWVIRKLQTRVRNRFGVVGSFDVTETPAYVVVAGLAVCALGLVLLVADRLWASLPQAAPWPEHVTWAGERGGFVTADPTKVAYALCASSVLAILALIACLVAWRHDVRE